MTLRSLALVSTLLLTAAATPPASAEEGPCDGGGAINLVLCATTTTESAVCVIVYGGASDPECVSDHVDVSVQAILHALCVIVYGGEPCEETATEAAWASLGPIDQCLAVGRIDAPLHCVPLLLSYLSDLVGAQTVVVFPVEETDGTSPPCEGTHVGTPCIDGAAPPCAEPGRLPWVGCLVAVAEEALCGRTGSPDPDCITKHLPIGAE